MVDDGLRTDGAGTADRLHTLLLAMSGRVDDDAVNSTREMAGAGQLDAAAEFLVGCLLAGRIPVTSTEQYELRRALDETRSQHTLADRLQVVDSVPPERHRFSDQHESDDDLIAALSPISARLTGVRALWCAWRASPAGVTYGAVPRRVLLAEVGAEGSSAAVGYQLLDALRRAGISCSVDVFTSGSELPEYHRDAMASARKVHLNVPVDVGHTSANHARAPRGSSGGDSSRTEPARADELRSPAPPELPTRSARPKPAEAPERDSGLPSEPSLPESTGMPAETSMGAPGFSDEPTLMSEPAAAQAQGEQDTAEQSGDAENMRVPAAVDAKLTDRERNLLRKLHEELAHREQEDGSEDEQAVPTGAGQSDSFSTMPGTGGFPPIQKH